MPTDFFGRVMVVFNRYGMSMLQGAGVSLKIALVGTLVGCIIGFAVGIVQTIPSERGDNPVKRAVLWAVKLILNAYVEFFRGTPMMAQEMCIRDRKPGVGCTLRHGKHIQELRHAPRHLQPDLQGKGQDTEGSQEGGRNL